MCINCRRCLNFTLEHHGIFLKNISLISTRGGGCKKTLSSFIRMQKIHWARITLVWFRRGFISHSWQRATESCVVNGQLIQLNDHLCLKIVYSNTLSLRTNMLNVCIINYHRLVSILTRKLYVSLIRSRKSPQRTQFVFNRLRFLCCLHFTLVFSLHQFS